MSRLLLTAIFTILILGASGTEEDPFLLYASDTVKLIWDEYPPTQVIEAAEFRIATTSTMTNVVRAGTYSFVDNPDTPTNHFPLREHLLTLEDGVYYVQVRVMNRFKKFSQWTDPVIALKDWTPPTTPRGCRIEY